MAYFVLYQSINIENTYCILSIYSSYLIKWARKRETSSSATMAYGERRGKRISSGRVSRSLCSFTARRAIDKRPKIGTSEKRGTVRRVISVWCTHETMNLNEIDQVVVVTILARLKQLRSNMKTSNCFRYRNATKECARIPSFSDDIVSDASTVIFDYGKSSIEGVDFELEYDCKMGPACLILFRNDGLCYLSSHRERMFRVEANKKYM